MKFEISRNFFSTKIRNFFHKKFTTNLNIGKLRPTERLYMYYFALFFCWLSTRTYLRNIQIEQFLNIYSRGVNNCLVCNIRYRGSSSPLDLLRLSLTAVVPWDGFLQIWYCIFPRQCKANVGLQPWQTSLHEAAWMQQCK